MRVEFREGTATRETVVLVHGFMGSAVAWGDLPDRLARRCRVVVPELPGHGGSDAPHDPAVYAVPRLAAMLGRLAHHVDAADAVWLGYSMGGRILLGAVAEGVLSPRHLILESASPGLATAAERSERRRLDEVRAASLEGGGIEAFVDGWLTLPLFATQRRLPADVRERERARRLAADPRALAACLRGGGTGSQPSYWSDLGTLPVPTLLVTGALDEKFRRLAAEMAVRLPRGRSWAVEGAGHAVHLEAPDAWLRAVESTLSGP